MGLFEFREIVTNAGDEPSVMLKRVVEGRGGSGYNAANGEFGDMIEFGILDLTKVTRTALQNVALIAGQRRKAGVFVGKLASTVTGMTGAGKLGLGLCLTGEHR